MPAAAPAPLAAAVTATPLGFAGIALSPAGIRRATLFHVTEAAAWAELESSGAQPAPHPRAAEALALLRAYATDGGDHLQHFPVDLPPASQLQSATWLMLRTVPRGQTRSYGWLAARLGLPSGAARAIGAAVGANPVPLWLPCHRIVASDGRLHGFAGGLAMKQALLELEGALPSRIL